MITLFPTKLVPLILALAWCTISWSANSGRVEQKRKAESEHTELRKKLSDLKQEIINTESAKHRAEDTLANSEAAISQANRKIVELNKEQQQTEQKLAKLSKQQRQLEDQVGQHKKQFSALLRQQYETGNTDRVKLLLSGDNPNRINRDMQYLGYLSKSQSKLINQLRENLAAVEENKLALNEARLELHDIAAEHQQQKSELVKEKARRAELIKHLSDKLSAQRNEVGQLQKNEQRLAELVRRLDKLIEEQREAAQNKQAKRKAGTDAKTLLKISPNKKTDHITEASEINSDGSSERSAFSQMKGHIRLPVNGELTGKFGGRRGEGTVWRGLFIRAKEGADIKSIASGKVIFADWLRGFGNLIILDHGAQYMSIYGNNEALLKQAGEQVNAGEAIATVGNSGGNEQSGLYFELRFQGKPFNPLKWINLK
ncbi:MAG: protease [Solimicrobium sp.]|nr:protease [Solimicrobium sp.]